MSGTSRAERAARRALWLRCVRGEEPAEVLDPVARAGLVYGLWRLGWSDERIAGWTRMTAYTVGRIRRRGGWPAHQRLRAG